MAIGKKTGGRQKGTPNKLQMSMKHAIQTVYDKLQDGRGGDHAHFLAWAQSEPTEFYRIASKLLPIQTEVTGADGGPVQVHRIELTGVRPSDG